MASRKRKQTTVELVQLVCLQRRYLQLAASAQTAYRAGHKSEFQMLLPLAERLQKEIDRRFARIPASQITKATDSDDIGWLLVSGT